MEAEGTEVTWTDDYARRSEEILMNQLHDMGCDVGKQLVLQVIKEAVAAEREECAKIAHKFTQPSMDSNLCCEETAKDIEQKIRERV